MPKMILVEFNGETGSLGSFARKHGIGFRTALSRYNRGWPLDLVFNAPVGFKFLPRPKGNGHTRKGGWKSTTYNTWQHMRRRCELPTEKHYHSYGGRGIKVCERWQTFANFLADMGEKPRGLSIERINNDGNYEPSNCRWATAAEQSRNTRRTHFVTHNGKRLCLTDWAKEMGITYRTLRERIQNGWSIIKAISAPNAYTKARP